MLRIVFCALGASLGIWLSVHPAAAQIELPPGPHRDLVYGQCRTCHDLQYLVDSAGIPRDAWNDVVVGMRKYGLRVPDDQRAKILDYLTTYLGPNPPKEAAAAEPQAAPSTDGAAIFKEQCAACHQPNGKGVPGQFPPLAGNHDLFVDQTFPVHVLLHGLEGPIKVEGKTFESAMPPFDHLADASIAAVVNYVRGAWNNGKLRPAGIKDVDPATVAAARRSEMTPTDVLAYRAARK